MKREDDAPYLDATSAAFIRAAGQLNAKLRQVTKVGVNVFVGSYRYWDIALEAIEPDVEDEEYVQRPGLCERVLITFSERDDEFLLADGPGKHELEEACWERAARSNYKRKFHPDVVDKCLKSYYIFMEFGEKFLSFNREYWNKQKALEVASSSAGQVGPDGKVVLLRRSGEDHGN